MVQFRPESQTPQNWVADTVRCEQKTGTTAWWPRKWATEDERGPPNVRPQGQLMNSWPARNAISGRSVCTAVSIQAHYRVLVVSCRPMIDWSKWRADEKRSEIRREKRKIGARERDREKRREEKRRAKRIRRDVYTHTYRKEAI